MERKILVYENFSSSEPKKLGILYVDTLRGIEHYSFEYDQDWLKQSKFSFCLDPIFQCLMADNILKRTFLECLQTLLQIDGDEFS